MRADDSSKTVLLLDDEKLVRMTICSWFRSSDFFVEAVATAEAALARLREKDFSVIISDVMMSGMDGFAFRDEVRKIRPNVPFIFLTSLVNDTDNLFMKRVMSDANSYYVTKDSPKEYLIGKVCQVVKASQAEREMNQIRSSEAQALHLAQLVQRTMMPPWTIVTDTFYYGALWQPLDTISGDLGYYRPVNGGDTFFILGDISGHGVSAAMSMMAVQSFLKRFDSFPKEELVNLKAVAERVHAFIHQNLHGLAYMTAIIGYFDVGAGTFRYLNAGCVDPLCFRRGTGECLAVNPECRGTIPLGLTADYEVRASDIVEVKVDESMCFLYLSDGLTDLSSDEDGSDSVTLDTIREIASEIVKNHLNGLTSLPFTLYAMLNRLGYVHPRDDITVVSFGLYPTCDDAFAVEVELNPAAIDAVAQSLGAYVRERYPGSETLAVKCELIVNEHLMNVHDHGIEAYARRFEKALLRVVADGDYLVMTIWDRGCRWDGPEDPRSNPEAVFERQNEQLGSHGRGEAIVREIAVRISRLRLGALNRNVFYLPIKADEKEKA